jgi:membrane associated rhomboid family serine protease
MIQAAVGFQCPECVKQGARATRQNQGPYGGQISTNPRQTSIVLIVINAVVWAVITAMGRLAPKIPLEQYLGLMPQGICAVADRSGMYWQGMNQAACQATANGLWIPGVADGAWWQLVTSIFTHVSIMHIAMNCLTLWFIGPPLESYLGRARFLATYLLAGLFGSLAVYWLSAPYSLSYGGSGSLFGVMGALAIILWRQKGDFRQLLMWIGLNIVITFVGGGSISWQAHLGGLVGGAILACIWVFTKPSPHRARDQWILIGVTLAVIALGLAARTPMLI